MSSGDELTQDVIMQRIKELLTDRNKTGKVLTAETLLDADLSIDSAAAMELIMEIEDSFDIDININQVGELHSVGDLVNMVQKQMGNA